MNGIVLKYYDLLIDDVRCSDVQKVDSTFNILISPIWVLPAPDVGFRHFVVLAKIKTVISTIAEQLTITQMCSQCVY